ncbi:MAG TPA: cyclase family protein [Burkholderiales bacterium]|nr:cyclase family protein [Burkholderiales bacterium]HXJ08874.1 cyclase family protein [Burkholderiales bacterium]
MRWKNRPEGSNWGEFGPDDQRGRMNYVTREKVLQGIAEVKEGITFCCSLPLDYPGGQVLNPRRAPPRLAATWLKDKQFFARPLADFNENMTDVICDDQVLMALQYSTQWDSFAHVGGRFDADGDGKAEVVFYNGFRPGEHIVPAPENPNPPEPWARFEGTQAKALGIQGLAEHGVQGRGVLLDFHFHFQRQRKALGYDDVMRVMEKDKVVVEKGDMVCIYTGFADVILEMKKKPDIDHLNNSCTGLNGRDQKLLKWISDSGLAVLLADNYAVELIATHLTDPLPRKQPWLPLHEHCLFKNGIHLGELFYFTELAKWLREHKRNRFLFTAPPLRLPGAVGSPATPIATV